MNYWTEGHFGHWTLKFTCFVLPGHYGCPRAFKQKSFFVEGILKPEFMKLVYSIKYMSQMCRLEFDVAFTMLFITPLTLSRKDKLTITKTLPSRFTKKSTSLTHYSSKMFICMKNGKQKTQLGSVSVLNLIVASIFKKKSHLNLSNLEKRYQSTILRFLSIFQTCNLKLMHDPVAGNWNSFVSSNGSRKPEITALRIE